MFRCRTLQIQILNEKNEMNAIDDDLDSDTDCRELHCNGCFDNGLRIHLPAHQTLPLGAFAIQSVFNLPWEIPY